MAEEARGPNWAVRRAAALRAGFVAGLGRLQSTALPILQCSVGAGLAWFVAKNLVGHVSPFFAPIAAVISLGVSLGSRWRRAVELVCGVMLGIAIGDLLVRLIGHGWWQISFFVAAAMVAATFIDKGLIFPMQAASSSLLVVLFPASAAGASIAGPSRLVDAFIGGVIGILISALLPAHPFFRAHQAAAAALATGEEVLRGVAEGLAARDAARLEEVLATARASQPQIDALQTYVRAGDEIVRISPLFWTYRDRVHEVGVSADHVDRIIRDLRVLARRAWILVNSGGKMGAGLVGAIGATADAMAKVRLLWLVKWPDQALKDEALAALEACAARLDPTMLSGVALSAEVVFAQLESTIFDLFQAAGFDSETALRALREA
ncbi:MAG: FUSC family protein [Segniliparus sp.]|uniref:FUSC family protein n=1 Tax=Segniliparus sp. TaxID=2804064 RepID=UPI003F2DF11A